MDNYPAGMKPKELDQPHNEIRDAVVDGVRVKYALTAEVNGEEVYRQESGMMQVIEMSTGHAERAVDKEIDVIIEELRGRNE